MIFFFLLFGHALADYPLQGDFLARGKNHKAPIEGVPWWQCLMAHSIIHGGFVAIITGQLFFGVVETIAHAFIDFGKCHKFYGYSTDQLMHVLCKIFYVVVLGELT